MRGSDEASLDLRFATSVDERAATPIRSRTMPDLPDLPKAEAAIVELTNTFRKENRLSPVTSNKDLQQAARLFAAYLARTGKFAHEADGRQPAERASASGYRFCMIAENLALNLDSRGFTTGVLATKAVDGWKASPGHRENMLTPHVTEIGVGIARAPDADPKYLSVQLFGRPEALQYSFGLANRTEGAIAYKLGERSHTLEPRVTATHTACTPSEIVLDRAGNWLTGRRIEGRYQARAGALFTLRERNGRISVDVSELPPR